MPIYEFTCQGCGAEFEELVLGRDVAVECPECRGRSVVRRMSACSHRSSGRFVSGSKSSCDSCNCSPGSCRGCHH